MSRIEYFFYGVDYYVSVIHWLNWQQKIYKFLCHFIRSTTVMRYYKFLYDKVSFQYYFLLPGNSTFRMWFYFPQRTSKNNGTPTTSFLLLYLKKDSFWTNHENGKQISRNCPMPNHVNTVVSAWRKLSLDIIFIIWLLIFQCSPNFGVKRLWTSKKNHFIN